MRRVIVVGLLAACGLTALQGCGGGNATGTARGRPSGSGAAPLGVGEAIPVARAQSIGVAAGDGSVWVAGTMTISRINEATHTVVATIPMPRGALGVAVGDGAVWVTAAGSVSRIDPRTNRVVTTIPVGAGTAAVVAGPGALWVANSSDGTVSRIDPRTNRVVATIEVTPPGTGPGRQWLGPMAQVDGAVWVASNCETCPGHSTLSRIDPRTDTVVARVDLGFAVADPPADHGLGYVTAMASGAGALWVTQFQVSLGTTGGHTPIAGRVVRVDPLTGRAVAAIPLSHALLGVAAGKGMIWVTDCADATVTGIDPTTNRVTGVPVRVGKPVPDGDFKALMADLETRGHHYSCPSGVTAGHGGVWVVNIGDGAVVPLTLPDSPTPPPVRR
jgi:YVTN family beta-propeller protein